MKRAVVTLMAVVCAAVVGCNTSTDDEALSDESQLKEGDYEFAFEDGKEDLERLDTMGVPLLGTILANKDRNLKGERLTALASGQSSGDEDDIQSLLDGIRKKVAEHVVTPYRASAPYVGTGYLIALFDANFMKLHRHWRDSLVAAEYPPCSLDLGLINPVAPCTVQDAIDDDGSPLGKVAQILVPDWLTVNVTKTARFPNGRTPEDPVGDIILALGFLKMGATCPDGKPCNARTFANLKHADGSVGTNPPKNDRQTFKTFPYLATPWFYWKDGDGAYERGSETLDPDACTEQNSAAGHCPYWPKGDRRKTPGPPGTKYAAPNADDEVSFTPRPVQR